MAVPDTITTDRLSLRPHRDSDVDDVFSYARDSEWQRFLPIPRPYAKEHAQEYLDTVAQFDREQHPTWAVCIGEQVIGSVNIRFVADHRIAEVGYGVSRSHWGRGITTEAMRAVINAAFEAYPLLQRIRARADSENVGSRRVMEKLGMTFEGEMRLDRFVLGELRDEVVYGLLREEWTILRA